MNAPARKSMSRSFAYNSANLALNILFPLASFAYAARVLGPVGLGRVGFAFAIAAIFLLLAAMPLLGAKVVSQARDNQTHLDSVFSELFILNAAFSAACLLGFACMVALVPAFRSDWILFLIAGTSLLFNMAGVDWLYVGIEDFRSLLFRNFAVKTLTLILLFILVRSRDDAFSFATLNVLSAGASNLWGLVVSGRVARFRLSKIRPATHLRRLAQMTGSSAAGGIYTQADTVLLGLLAGHQAVGMYSAAMKLPRMASTFLASLGMTAMPRLAYQAEAGTDPDHARKVGQNALRLFLFLCLPVSALMAVHAPGLIMLISGPEYAQAALTLRIAVPLILLAGTANFIGMQVLYPYGGEKAILVGAVAGAVCNLALNAVLIPRLGAHGSAAAAAATEAVVLMSLLYQARGRIGHLLPLAATGLKYLIVSAVSAALSGMVAGGIGTPWLAMLVGLAGGGLLYIAPLWFAKDAFARMLLSYPSAMAVSGR